MSGLVSFQTDQSIWCVLVAFLTKPSPQIISKYCLGTYDNLPAQYTTIFHVKMFISHDIEIFSFDFVKTMDSGTHKNRLVEPLRLF